MIEDWFDTEQVVIVQGQRAKKYKDGPDGVDDVEGLRPAMKAEAHKVMKDAKDRGIRLWIFSGGEAGGDTIFGEEAEEMGHKVIWNPAIADVVYGDKKDPNIDTSSFPARRKINQRFMDIMPPAMGIDSDAKEVFPRNVPQATSNYLKKLKKQDRLGNWNEVRQYLRDDPEGKIAAGTATTADLPLPEKGRGSWFADDFQFRNLANIYDATIQHQKLAAASGKKTLPMISMTLHDTPREGRRTGGTFGNENKVMEMNVPVYDLMGHTRYQSYKSDNPESSFNSIWDRQEGVQLESGESIPRGVTDYSSTTGKPVVVVPVNEDGKISIGEGLAALSQVAPKTYEHQQLEFKELLKNPDIEIRKSTDIQPEDIINNPNAIFIFGDNVHRTGKGGQAKVFRDLQNRPNVVGIATKQSPQELFTDSDKAEERQIKNQDKDFKSLYYKISLLRAQSSLDSVLPSRDVIDRGSKEYKEREKALLKFHKEEYDKEFFGGEEFGIPKTEWLSAEAKNILGLKLKEIESETPDTIRKKAQEEYKPLLADEIRITGSIAEKREDLGKSIGYKIDKDREIKKSVTLQSDIDDSGIEKSREISIRKDLGLPTGDLEDTVTEDVEAGTGEEPSGIKIDVTPEYVGAGAGLNLDTFTLTGDDPEAIATVEGLKAEFGAGKGPKQLIQEKVTSDILKPTDIEAIEARDYVSTANLKEWWNSKTGFTVPTHERTSFQGESPALPSAQSDYEILNNKMWVNPDDGKVYPLVVALEHKFGGTPLPEDGGVSRMLTVTKEVKQIMSGKEPTLEDISSLMPIGTKDAPPVVAGDIEEKLYWQDQEKDAKVGVTFQDKELLRMFEKKNNELVAAGKPELLFTSQIEDMVTAPGAIDKVPPRKDTTISGLTEAQFGAKRRAAASSLLQEVINLEDEIKRKETINRQLPKTQFENLSFEERIYSQIPESQRKQFEADLGEIATTGGQPENFHANYQSILTAGNRANRNLNKEELSGTKYFTVKNGEFVSQEAKEGPAAKKAENFEDVLDIKQKEAFLISPKYDKGTKTSIETVAQSIASRGYKYNIGETFESYKLKDIKEELNQMSWKQKDDYVRKYKNALYREQEKYRKFPKRSDSFESSSLVDKFTGPTADMEYPVDDSGLKIKDTQPHDTKPTTTIGTSEPIKEKPSDTQESGYYKRWDIKRRDMITKKPIEDLEAVPDFVTEQRLHDENISIADETQQYAEAFSDIDITKGPGADGNYFDEVAALGLKTEIGPLKDKYGDIIDPSRFKIGSFEEELSHHPRDKYVVDDMGKRLYGSTIGFKQDIADKLMERARREISRTEEQGVRDAIIKRYEEGDWKPDKEHIDIDDPRVSQEIRDKIVEEAGVRRRHPGEREEDKRRRELANLVRRPLYSGKQKPDTIHDFDGQRIKETAESQWLAKKYAEGWTPDDVKRYQQQEDLRGWEERFGDKKREKELESFYLNKKQKERVVPENMNTGRNLSKEAEDIAESLKRRNLIDDDIKRSKAQSTLYRQRVENLYTKPKTSSQDGRQHEDSEVDFKIEDSIDESLSNTSKVVDLTLNESRILQLQPNKEFNLNGAIIETSAQTMYTGKPSSTVQIRNKETGKTEFKDIFYIKENPRVFSGGNYEFVSSSNVGGQGQSSTHEAEHVQDNVSQAIKDIDAKKNFYKAEDEPTYSNSSRPFVKSMANDEFPLQKSRESDSDYKKRLEKFMVEKAQKDAFQQYTIPAMQQKIGEKAAQDAINQMKGKRGRIMGALSRGKSGVTSRAQTVAGGSGQKGRGVIEGMSAIMQQRHQQKMQQAQLDAITGRGRGRGKRDTVMDAIAMAQSLTQPQQQQFGGGQGLFSSQGTQQMMGSGQSRLTDFSIQGTSRGSALTDFAGRVGTQGLGLGSNLAGQMMSGEGTRGIFTTGKEFLQSRGQPSGMQFVGQRERDIMSFSLGGTLGLGGSMRPEQGLGSPSGFLAGELISQTQTQNRAPNGRNNGAGFRGRNNR